MSATRAESTGGLNGARAILEQRYSRVARERSLAGMERRARGRLDYNESRSGYAAPATELALYVLILARQLRTHETHAEMTL